MSDLHRGLILLLAVAALSVAVLALLGMRRARASRTTVLPWMLAASALLVALVELVAGPGPVHDAHSLPPPVWGTLEGFARGVLLATGGALVVCWPSLRHPPPAHAPEPRPRASAGPVGLIAGALVVVTVAQLALGIGQRASRDLLLGHAVLGIAVVLPLTIRLGIAVFLVSPDRPLVRRLGLALAVLVGLQTVLGVGLLLPRAALWSGGWTRDVHQSVGSLVVCLAAAVLAAARPTAAAGRRDPPASP